MLSKRSIQEASVAFFLNGMIDEAELQSILEITNKKNPSFPYWKYDWGCNFIYFTYFRHNVYLDFKEGFLFTII